ncbi:acyl-CoA thioesterase [Gluconacetobacter entanii]|uniref:Acyl-CoA thioesterase n=1 Tax=Gluconacetobacter entanii TaxID=108528 RepID=A0A318PNR0_9PROT|nr:acyl-CoA thioesterase [Gluconacetobacter entanii]PYD61649.1 acyl-CoA thioesterase [Gluconacetobacter entanii]
MREHDAMPSGELTIRVVAMPADINPAGDIFGGWLMSQMDLAASTTAALCAGGRCATVAIDRVVFHRPVSVVDEVSIYTQITKIGRTSMTIAVEAWRRVRHASVRQKVTEGHFVFVALDENGRPRPVDTP